jgi:hypothetical protein
MTNRDTIPGHPNSLQEHKASAKCRRNGEGILWSHDLSYAFIGMITKLSHRGGSVARKKPPGQLCDEKQRESRSVKQERPLSRVAVMYLAEFLRVLRDPAQVRQFWTNGVRI